MSILIGNPKYINPSKCSSVYFKKEIHNDLLNVINQIKTCLIKINVHVSEVVQWRLAEKNKLVCHSLWIRDNFIKMDNIFLILPLTKKSSVNQDRSHEYKNIIQLLNKNNEIYYIIHQKNVKIEGGDIIQNKNTIFYGLSNRSNKDGFNLIKKINADYWNKDMYSIKHNALHLDCCFCLLKNNTIIYSKKYIKKLNTSITNTFKCVVLEDILENDSATNLALNFLMINNNIIITKEKEYSKLRQFLRKMGYKLHLVDFKYNTIVGGSVRCLTQWLHIPKNVDIH